MTDRPVIFSAPMVLALLREAAEQGTGKSMTRRPLYVRRTSKNGKSQNTAKMLHGHPTPTKLIAIEDYWTLSHWHNVRVGGRLWVRENFARVLDGAIYRADGEKQPGSCCGCAWRSSIHMPRKFSRLTLIVTAVRIERLQEITEQDAEREGVVYESADPAFTYVPGILPHSITAVGMEQMRFGPMEVVSFSKLWNHINGAGAWEANPEVVAVSFTVRKRNIDAAAL